VAIHIVANFKGCALPGVALEHIKARLTDRGNIGYLNAVARSRAGARLARLSLQNPVPLLTARTMNFVEEARRVMSFVALGRYPS
jgi:hypothetical protein